MGFWNKIKQGFTQLTGGGGNIQLQVQNPQAKRGENLNVQITLNCTSQLSGKSINLEVAGLETIKYQVPVQNSTPAPTPAGTTTSTTTTTPTSTTPAPAPTVTTTMEDRTKTNQTYHNAVVVDASPVNMQQGESKQYNASIPIPATVQPTYEGTDAKHEWRVRAFLDVPMGADIDEDAEITVL